MNILILARGDWSGAGHALAEAVRAHTPHAVRQVAMRDYWTRYPADEFAPSQERIAELLDWADVWNLHDDAHTLAPSGTQWKPTVITYHGSHYRAYHEAWNAEAKARGWQQTVLTQDLSRFGPQWLGRPQADLSFDWQPLPGRIVHAPTKRDAKGTEAVVEAIRNLPGVTLDLIEWQPWAECLRRKAQAWLCIDQIGPLAQGYGTNALEAWAYGMPVISGSSDDVADRIEALAGGLPYLDATPATLREQIMLLRDDETVYRHWQAAGQRVLQAHHAPAVVAERFVKLCEDACG